MKCDYYLAIISSVLSFFLGALVVLLIKITPSTTDGCYLVVTSSKEIFGLRSLLPKNNGCKVVRSLQNISQSCKEGVHEI